MLEGETVELTEEYVKGLIKCIYSHLARIVNDKAHLTILLNETALKKWWIPAFTHESVDATTNYQKLEFQGDTLLKYVFTTFVVKKVVPFKSDTITLIMGKYMSRKYQAELAISMGLSNFIRHINIKSVAPLPLLKIQEDVFEAFFGALGAASDALIQEGQGSVYASNLIKWLFRDSDQLFQNVEKDNITTLKEMFDNNNMPEPVYECESDGMLMKCRVLLSVGGEVVGQAEDKIDEVARQAAAGNALAYFQKNPINPARRQKKEEEKNEYQVQAERVKLAIAKLNDMLRSKGKVEIKDHRIITNQSGNETTQQLMVQYQISPTSHEWKMLSSQTGTNPQETKIALLRNFADRYLV